MNECVAKGLAVVQGDADTDLVDYPDDAFDFVILSQTLQATRQPRVVLEHMLRIGRHAIVSFPNFGHWDIRLQLLLGGHMPRTDNLPYAWYETPNIHFCSIKDFRQLCLVVGAKMDQAVALNAWGRQMRLENAVVVLESVRRAGGVSVEPGRVIVAHVRAHHTSDGPVAQWSELAAHNRLVGGSSPPGPTILFRATRFGVEIVDRPCWRP